MDAKHLPMRSIQDQLCGAADVSQILGVNMARASQLMRGGDCPSVMIGASWVTTRWEIEELKRRRANDPNVQRVKHFKKDG